MSPTAALAQKLVQIQSVTPVDGGCQSILSRRLTEIGFKSEQLNFQTVTNLWTTHGNESPLIVFAGHTDVVPTGPESQWQYPPFSGKVKGGFLHGRGAADMKGSIASFVTACERFVANHPDHQGTIGLLITSDEEGPADWGTRAVVETLNQRGEKIDMCIVGEPTSVYQLGDMLKVGRRGSLNGRLTVLGKQGHVAYPHLADNPLHTVLPALTELTNMIWDQGNSNFQPTCLQISNINGGTGVSNVIPGKVEILFNFRFSPESTDQQLKAKVEAVLNRYHFKFELDWAKTGHPYETSQGSLVEAVSSSIQEIIGINVESSTTGGTSDGKFIAPTGAQVVELGPINATIHQVNEHINIQDLETLSKCYERVLEKVLISESL